jgi:hypothetical protein
MGSPLPAETSWSPTKDIGWATHGSKQRMGVRWGASRAVTPLSQGLFRPPDVFALLENMVS